MKKMMITKSKQKEIPEVAHESKLDPNIKIRKIES